MHKNLADDTTDVNVGTAGEGVTATEYGDGRNKVTKLVFSSIPITIGDNASAATGALIYTLPAGACHISFASASVSLTLTEGSPTTDTPEVGLGTTVGSGSNATLGAVAAAAENIAGPAVMNDIAGTAEVFDTASDLAIGISDDHTVYLNFADGWANVDDTAATASGTVYLSYSLHA